MAEKRAKDWGIGRGVHNWKGVHTLYKSVRCIVHINDVQILRRGVGKKLIG